MGKFIINKDDFVQMPEILTRVRYCLCNESGFSLVRVGDAENQVLAQGWLYSEADLKNIWWANNEDWTGITLPNYEAGNHLVRAIIDADLVGVLHQDDEFLWRPLTEANFSYYGIRPRQVCYAFINTYLPEYPEFIDLLKTYRTLLVGKMAPAFSKWLLERYQISTANLVISNYAQVPGTLRDIEKIDCSLVLISAGSNAVILASALAKMAKVALDIGRAMNPELWEK